MESNIDDLFNDDIDWSIVNSSQGENSQEDTTQSDQPDSKYLDVLQKRFGHRGFRPMQWRIIHSILIERRDVCAIMATGYGKSLCYQFPSVYSGGITIVISPLISLMEDQVLALKMSNIAACLLGSAQNHTDLVMEDLLDGNYSIMYATPEFCLCEFGSSFLKQVYEKIPVHLLAIDEAHCVSQWGHDFRSQYRKLSQLRSILQGVPILAVTATATQTVQQDIIKSLSLNDPLLLCSGFDRPNLYFEVKMRRSADPFSVMKSCMLNTAHGYRFPGPTIVYCLTRNKCTDVSENLRVNGIANVIYHAGLTIKQRREAHEQFIKDKVKVVVATIAFGMGIDKPDVRTIIHYGASKDIEGYYQEVGRAGRDGLPAKCFVFYSNADFITHERLRDMSNGSHEFKKYKEEGSNIMEQYLNTQDCRRQFILKYFGDEISDSSVPKRSCCDNCARTLIVPNRKNLYVGVDDSGLYNYTEDAVLFLRAVTALNGKFGITMYVLLLRGSKSTKLYERYQKMDIYGKGKHCSDDWWKIIGRILTAEGYLKKSYQKSANKMSYTTVSISDKGKAFLSDVLKNKNTELKILPTPEMKTHLKLKPVNQPNSQPTSTWIDKQTIAPNKEQNTTITIVEDPIEKMYRIKVYEALLHTRNNIAHRMDCTPYSIASNSTLMQLSKCRPTTISSLKSYAIDGLNEGKIEKFGQHFIDCIIKYQTLHPPPTATSNVQQKPSDISALNTNSSQTIPQNKLLETKDIPVTRVRDLRQFAFVEKKSITVNNPEQNLEPDIDMDNEMDIADDSLNEIFDAIEANEETTATTKVEEPKENDDDDNIDWLNSPNHESDVANENFNSRSELTSNSEKKQNLDDSFMFESDSFDLDLVNVVENIENVTESKVTKDDVINNANLNTKGIKTKAESHCTGWWEKRKKLKLSKYLDE